MLEAPPETSQLLAKYRIVLGVSGGIAAYKAVEVCRGLVKHGAHVTPVLTAAAEKMVGAATFSALASEKAKTSLWHDSQQIPHTFLGQNADLVLVCPATARIISDLTTGRSADLLSATLIATEAPVVLCPAMHTEMWQHPAVQHNIETLSARGTGFVDPVAGQLAGQDSGMGRLADPQAIIQKVLSVAGVWPKNVLAGKKVLVTAGGTREPIDPVRYIGNFSSGKQGHAIAAVAAKLGANVVLVTTSSIETAAGIERVQVSTSIEMFEATTKRSAEQDVIVMAAAVADFKPTTSAESKIKKADWEDPKIVLEPTVDILAHLGKSKPSAQVLVGFAAETNDLRANALKKLKSKGADIIVANDVSAPGTGFGSEMNQVTILKRDGAIVEVPKLGKEKIAETILHEVAKCFD